MVQIQIFSISALSINHPTPVSPSHVSSLEIPIDLAGLSISRSGGLLRPSYTPAAFFIQLTQASFHPPSRSAIPNGLSKSIRSIQHRSVNFLVFGFVLLFHEFNIGAIKIDWFDSTKGLSKSIQQRGGQFFCVWFCVTISCRFMNSAVNFFSVWFFVLRYTVSS